MPHMSVGLGKGSDLPKYNGCEKARADKHVQKIVGSLQWICISQIAISHATLQESCGILAACCGSKPVGVVSRNRISKALSRNDPKELPEAFRADEVQ